MVVGEDNRGLTAHPPLPNPLTSVSRRHGKLSWKTTNRRKRRRRRWRQKREKLGAQVKRDKPDPGSTGRVRNWV